MARQYLSVLGLYQTASFLILSDIKILELSFINFFVR